MKNSAYSFSKLLFLLVFMLAGCSIFASENTQSSDFYQAESDTFKSAPSKIFLPKNLNEDSLLQKAEEEPISEFKLQTSFSVTDSYPELKKETSKAQISAASNKQILYRQIFPFHFFW
ncbi:hypothetical protein MKO06_05585 [Gramella sp. GC03-9]|uniref:Lipoprotein n=1 Tax=Christiangramia oceanisediminis TaxID=2920386 RepID=A0A9X2IAW0_9FLAO|nr:hypothetical protein [Gramella oceanisediminis]MCP9199368.1 hypothetical protein [Gramella oceanisediminis]